MKDIRRFGFVRCRGGGKNQLTRTKTVLYRTKRGTTFVTATEGTEQPQLYCGHHLAYYSVLPTHYHEWRYTDHSVSTTNTGRKPGDKWEDLRPKQQVRFSTIDIVSFRTVSDQQNARCYQSHRDTGRCSSR